MHHLNPEPGHVHPQGLQIRACLVKRKVPGGWRRWGSAGGTLVSSSLPARCFQKLLWPPGALRGPKVAKLAVPPYLTGEALKAATSAKSTLTHSLCNKSSPRMPAPAHALPMGTEVCFQRLAKCSGTDPAGRQRHIRATGQEWGSRAGPFSSLPGPTCKQSCLDCLPD